MTVVRFGRRHFLRGAGGCVLALPFMESLLPREVLAQSVAPRPRFVAIATEHGGVYSANMWPKDAMLTEKQNLYTNHQIRRGALTLGTIAGRPGFSPVLSSSKLTPALGNKMNVLRGLDIPWFIGHHCGGHLGDYTRTSTGEVPADMKSQPTIDQLLAYSPSFYSSADLAMTKQRSMHTGMDAGDLSITWGYSNPAKKTGAIVAVPTSKSSLDLFKSIFVPPASTQPQTRRPVVEQVLESYKQLSTGAFGAAKRLSVSDKRRLDEHMSRLSELEMRANVMVSCTATPPATVANDAHPGSSYDSNNLPASAEYFRIFNEVIAIAFACGTSRIATIHVGHRFSSFAGDWHQQIAHLCREQEQQVVLAEAHRQTFESIFLDLAARLDVEEADGKTYLDNTLMTWSQESGPITHESYCLPVVTAGGAAGALRTGQYVDYRRLTAEVIYEAQLEYPGVYYNRWLSTALTAMGIPMSEYGAKGYASNHRTEAYGGAARWPDQLEADTGKPLPYLMT